MQDVALPPQSAQEPGTGYGTVEPPTPKGGQRSAFSWSSWSSSSCSRYLDFSAADASRWHGGEADRPGRSHPPL